MPKLIDYTKMETELSPAKQALADLAKMQVEMKRLAEVLVQSEAEASRAKSLAKRVRQGLPERAGRPFQSEQEWRHWSEILPDKKADPPYGEAAPLPDHAISKRGKGRDPKGEATGKLETLLRKFGKLAKRT